MANNRGSEWRKWDLHVHTPMSIENNYGGDTPEIWEKYIDALEHLPTEIKVIGINDYLFIDGYRKVLEFKSKGRLQNIELILPVVEFRLAKFCGNEKFKRINFHVIFSDQLSPELIQSQFLNTLTQSYILSPDYKQYWSGVITKDSLADLGKHIIESIPEDRRCQYGSPLKEGFNNLNLEQSSIMTPLRSSSYFKGKFITAIGKSEWDDLKWDDGTISDKKSIINGVDLVFTAAENVESYNKSKLNLQKQGVKDLLLDCSDAHDFSDAKTKDRLGNCNTWIKADTTFDGLKQIIYEPTERIRIQLDKPDYKPQYQVIDSITLQEVAFWNDEIYLNENLNVIIGGRSTGKSTLLSAIACKLKTTNKEQQTESFDFVEQHIGGLHVKWKDNQEKDDREIEYFPQNYMHNIIDRKELFDEIIQNIITDNDKRSVDTYIAKNNELQKELNFAIISLFQEQATQMLFLTQLKELGQKEDIEKEIENLEIKIKSFTDNSHITEAESCLYRQNIQSLAQKEQQIEVIDTDVTSLLSLQVVPIFSSDYTEKCSILSENTKAYLVSAFSELTKETETQWRGRLEKLVKDLQGQKQQYVTECKTIKESALFIKCAKYYQNNVELGVFQKRLDIEQKKLHTFVLQEEKCSAKQKEINRFIQEIVDKYIQFKINAEIVHSQLHITHDDIDVISNVCFYKEKLHTFLMNRFNVQGAERLNYVNRLVSEFDNPQTIKEYIEKALNGGIAYKSTHNAQSVMTEFLTQNWYSYSFDVVYQRDHFAEMSPGKQAFVVLKLLLEFSDKTCPILIDQPEDSLDNRAIYKELVQYIKQKKKSRQIILVTHNPNVVVSADAENVIVANQNGKNSPNENEVKFHYVNGSLENSKSKNDTIKSILEAQGIREHVCEILEGGKEAFEKREKKYGFR